MSDPKCIDSLLLDGLNDAFSTKHSGWHTKDPVPQYRETREAQDSFVARSRQRFATAPAAGYFTNEIEPMTLQTEKGSSVFVVDESARPDTIMESLARLKPAFRPDGSITHSNAAGVNAGTAAIIIYARSTAKELGLQSTLAIKSVAVSGVEPHMFGLGPISAIRTALERAGWDVDDVNCASRSLRRSRPLRWSRSRD